VDQLTSVTAVELVPRTVSGIEIGLIIDAIWGVERGTGLDIYAVGDVAGSPWLGRAVLDEGVDTFDGWASLEPPPGLQKLRSIWIGPDVKVDDGLVVVVVGSTDSGDGGAAVIRLDEL